MLCSCHSHTSPKFSEISLTIHLQIRMKISKNLSSPLNDFFTWVVSAQSLQLLFWGPRSGGVEIHWELIPEQQVPRKRSVCDPLAECSCLSTPRIRKVRGYTKNKIKPSVVGRTCLSHLLYSNANKVF